MKIGKNKDMIKCNVCGWEFEPAIDKHYISRDDGDLGFSAAFKSKEEKLYDTFDCPVCGCQKVVQGRKRVYVSKTHDFVMEEKDDCREEDEDKI